jgi:hypothetical protein
MSKKKSSPEVELNPLTIYFTHSKIRNVFSTGKPLEETLAEIERGDITVDDIPRIQVMSTMAAFIMCVCCAHVRQVMFDGERYFSMNNRRLWVFKELAKRNKLSTVVVSLETPKSGTQKKLAQNTLALEANMTLR